MSLFCFNILIVWETAVRQLADMNPFLMLNENKKAQTLESDLSFIPVSPETSGNCRSPFDGSEFN